MFFICLRSLLNPSIPCCIVQFNVFTRKVSVCPGYKSIPEYFFRVKALFTIVKFIIVSCSFLVKSHLIPRYMESLLNSCIFLVKSHFSIYFSVLHRILSSTMWAPPVVSLFVNPMNIEVIISYKYHKPWLLDLHTNIYQLSYRLGAPTTCNNTCDGPPQADMAILKARDLRRLAEDRGISSRHHRFQVSILWFIFHIMWPPPL